MSAGRAVLAGQKGVLQARLNQLERTASLNRYESKDPELEGEIRSLRSRIQEVARLETLWHAGNVEEFDVGYSRFRQSQHCHA